MLFPGHIENINIILDTNNMGVLTFPFSVFFFDNFNFLIEILFVSY